MACESLRLERGGHARGEDGHCLMEYVSLLNGGPFSMSPSCTHPVVAALATQVNDRTSDVGRAALVSRTPQLLRARSDDPALAWRLVGLCSAVVLAHRPNDRPAQRRLARSRRVVRRWAGPLARRWRSWVPEWCAVGLSLLALDELFAAFRSVLGAVGPVDSPARDHALAELLDAALASTDAGLWQREVPAGIVSCTGR